jgi:hypothetical protein
MTCVDADWRSTTVGVWNVGRDSGGEIVEYRHCRLEIEGLDLPHSAPLLSNDSREPFCLHGDEAFPLKKYLLRPGKNNCDINAFAAAGFLDFRGVYIVPLGCLLRSFACSKGLRVVSKEQLYWWFGLPAYCVILFMLGKGIFPFMQNCKFPSKPYVFSISFLTRACIK